MSNIHWSVKRLRSYNSYISMIVGDRGVGKTYSITKELLINDFLKNGTQFMYIRRKNTELDKIEMFFDDMIVNEEFEGHEFEVRKGQHGGKFYIDGKLAGHAFPL